MKQTWRGPRRKIYFMRLLLVVRFRLFCRDGSWVAENHSWVPSLNHPYQARALQQLWQKRFGNLCAGAVCGQSISMEPDWSMKGTTLQVNQLEPEGEMTETFGQERSWGWMFGWTRLSVLLKGWLEMVGAQWIKEVRVGKKLWSEGVGDGVLKK